MITFFALQPTAKVRQEIFEWKDRVLPPFDRPVTAANLHITLAYLGETAPWQLEQLLATAEAAMPSPIELTLDHMGYWPKPKVVWLGASTIPDTLVSLAGYLGRTAGSLRLQRDKRPYQPHLTLARKISQPPPAPAEAPQFQLRFTDFVLMESCRSAAGVSYRVLEHFC